MKRLGCCVALLGLALFLSCNKSSTSPSDPNPPAQPSSPTPADGATDWTVSSTLVWSCSDPGATVKFDLYLDTVTPPVQKVATGLDPVSTDANGLNTGKFATDNIKSNKTYYWKVTATNGVSTVSGDVWKFTTDPNPPDKPSIPTPVNGAVDWTTSSTLAWCCTGSGATVKFDLYLDTINPPARKVAGGLDPVSTDSRGLSTGNYAALNLIPNKVYYWQVTATNGISVVAGDVWKFTTYYYMIASAMKPIPAGSFQMGDQNTVIGGPGLPVHTVSVSAFFMDSTDVTEGDYGSVLNGMKPSLVAGVRFPVENMTWFDAVLYCNARSKRDGLDTVYSYSSASGKLGNGCTGLGNLVCDFTKNGYRLPTEAEWEYACRGTAGAATDFYWGRNYPPASPEDTAALLDHLYFRFYLGQQDVYMVAKRQPNDFGLYDMVGDVAQWCNDLYDANYYESSPAQNPTGPAAGDTRVVRGLGAEYNPTADLLISSYRNSADPAAPNTTIGFRCVRRQ